MKRISKSRRAVARLCGGFANVCPPAFFLVRARARRCRAGERDRAADDLMAPSMMPLFWIVHEIDGKRRIFIQEAGALITARIKASIAGFDEA